MIPARASVELLFSDGTRLDSFQSFKLHKSFVDPLGSLTIAAAPPRDQFRTYKALLQRGELVTLQINGTKQGQWLIQDVDRAGPTIQCTAHSLLVTPYEGGVDPDYSLSSQKVGDKPVSKAVLDALGPYGFTEITADVLGDLAAITGKPISGGLAPILVEELKHQDCHGKENESAYAFCAKIFIRLGAALHVTASGKLILVRPDYEQEPSYSLVLAADGGGPPGDRFLEWPKVHESNAGQFSEIILRGATPDTLGGLQTHRPIAKVTATSLHPAHPTYLSSAAPYKPKFLKDRRARDKATSTAVATAAFAARAPNAYYLQGDVNGFVSTTGRVWSINTIASVYHDLEEIDEDMWILEKTLTEDKDGQKASLKLLPKYMLNLGDAPS
jgi:hypothetical protein